MKLVFSGGTKYTNMIGTIPRYPQQNYLLGYQSVNPSKHEYYEFVSSGLPYGSDVAIYSKNPIVSHSEVLYFPVGTEIFPATLAGLCRVGSSSGKKCVLKIHSIKRSISVSRFS